MEKFIKYPGLALVLHGCRTRSVASGLSKGSWLFQLVGSSVHALSSQSCLSFLQSVAKDMQQCHLEVGCLPSVQRLRPCAVRILALSPINGASTTSLDNVGPCLTTPHYSRLSGWLGMISPVQIHADNFQSPSCPSRAWKWFPGLFAPSPFLSRD